MSMNIPNNRVFLESGFIDAMPGTHTMLCGFEGDPNNAGDPNDSNSDARYKWAGRPYMPGQALPSQIKDTTNNYVTVSVFKREADGSRRRRRTSFYSMHLLMVDDINTKVPFANVKLPPTALIETSPDNFQGFLFLKQDADSRERDVCERVVQRMIRAGLTSDATDPGMSGVTRYGRLPVGVNAKAKYVEKLGHPFRVRCVEFDPSRRYSIGEIAAAWGLDMRPDRPRAPVVQISEGQALHANKKFAALLHFFQVIGRYRGPISGGWHEIVCPWEYMHTDPTATGTALAAPSAANNFAGGFRCFHGHCVDRSMIDIRAFVEEFVRIRRERRGPQDV
jgi:RepB DNA-primase from phage plasmid